MPPNTRKLSAIVFADIVGYTALMQKDEVLALARLTHFEDTIKSESTVFHGEVIQFYGDGCLLVFDNVNEALACTLRMQQSFMLKDRLVPVRIGINVGEVVYRDNNIFGDSVNLTSRIESMGVPGAILLSRSAQQQVKNNRNYQLTSLGYFDFKNIDEPTEVFAVANSDLKIPLKEELKGKFKPPAKSPKSVKIKIALTITMVLLVAISTWRLIISNQTVEEIPAISPYKSLAIFPFANLSGNANLDYLADGVAESLINSVSNQSDIRVISRYSTTALKDSIHNLSFIQKMLNVDAILIGSVDQVDEELIFNTELISVDNNEHIWGDEIRGTKKELTEIEKRMTQAVLSSVATPIDRPAGGNLETINNEAYQHYMQGRFLSYGHTQKEIDQSVEHFHKAIELQPDFALAYAALANQKFAQARFSNTTRQEIIREAKLAISTARNIAPNLPEALLAEANSNFFYDFDWDSAEESFQKALQADPDNAVINSDFAFFQCAMNNYDQALVLAEKAISLDPVSISSMHIIAWTNLYLNPQRSLEEFDKIIELHPNWIWGYVKKSIAEILVGDCVAAQKTFVEIKNRKGQWGGELLESYMAVLYKTCGDEVRSKEKMQFVLDHVKDHGISDPLNISILYGGTGDLDQMITYAKQCIEQRTVNAALMQLVKDLDLFFNDPFADPRYVALLKEMKFPNN